MARHSFAVLFATFAQAAGLVPAFGFFDAAMGVWLDETTEYGIKKEIFGSFAPFFTLAAMFATLGRLSCPMIFRQRSDAWKNRKIRRAIRYLLFTVALLLLFGQNWDLVKTGLSLLFTAYVGFLLGWLDSCWDDNEEYNRIVALLDRGHGVELIWDAPGAQAPMVRLYREAALFRHRIR